MLLQRNNIISILDIGSSKIVCLIAKILANDEIQIIGTGYCASKGIKAGVITDINMAQNAISNAVDMAESYANEKVKRIYVSLGSSILLSQRITSSITVAGREINYKDINKMLFEGLDRYSKQSLDIIHSFVYDYVLDGNRGISNPLGMYGHNLSCYMHVLATPSNLLLNVFNCVNNCGINVENYISAAYSTGLSCLTEDEMKLGVTLIEFGGGNTSISIFENRHMIFSDAIALGGINITNDIARGLGISFKNAERLKNLYGALITTSIDDKEPIEVHLSDDDNTDTSTINRSILVEIIRARVEEIIELLIAKLHESKLDVTGKVVITGSGSHISGLKELICHLLNTHVRVGYPKLPNGINSHNSNTTDFSTSIGMLEHVVSTLKNQYGADIFSRRKYTGLMQRFWDWVKNNL